MRKYETIFILKPNLNEADVKTHVESIKAVITDNDGVINSVEEWGKKKLAYEIKKEKYGNYVFILFESRPDVIAVLERAYRLNESVIRHIVVLRPKVSKKAEKAAKRKETSSWEEAEGKAAEGKAAEGKAAEEKAAEEKAAEEKAAEEKAAVKPATEAEGE